MNTNEHTIVDAIRRLGHPDKEQREDAERLLREATPAPTWALIQATYPVVDDTRQNALKLLVDLAAPEAVDTFVEHLEDPASACRWLAAEGLVALGATGLERTLDLLREYPKTDWLLRGIHHVLSGLEKKGFAQIASPVLHAYQAKAPEIELPAAAAAARAKLAEREGQVSQ